MEDDISILLTFSFILFLILLNGFFVAAEFALLRVKKARLTELAEQGNKRAKIAEHVISRPDAYLTACLLGSTIASLCLGWISGPVIARYIVEPLLASLGAPASFTAPASFVIAFSLIAFIYVVFGELVPKSFAFTRAEGTSLWLSGPLMLLYRLFYPAIWLVNATAELVLKMIGVKSVELESGHTEEEIRYLIKESQKSGHIKEEELALMENIFVFSERVAREILIPRTMMACLYADATFEENLQIVQKERHTRFPIVESDKDHIIGLVHASDMYSAALSEKGHRDIRKLIRPITVVPESMKISQVLRTMQQDRIQMVAVVDEFGGTAGIITLEDIIEEIVGDIQDEFHRERAEVEVMDDRTSLDPRMLIQEINELFKINIENEEVNTIGGWVYSQINETPRAGQTVKHGDLEFVITEVEHLRIHRIEVNAVPVKEEDEEENLAEEQNMLEGASALAKGRAVS